MKLSSEQIEKLFHFTRQHYVEFYDLQTELVDHLANAIEAQWQENPNLNFDALLQLEFKKFGVFGFQDVIDKRKNALRKSYNSIVWNNFKVFFSIPTVVGTLLSVLILFQIFLKLSFAQETLQAIAFGIIIIAFTKLFINQKSTKNRFKQTTRKYMFDDCIQNYGYTGVTGFIGSLIPQLIVKSSFIVKTEPFWLLVFCFFLISLIIFFYIILFQIPQKTELYLLQKYPNIKIHI